MRLVTMIGNHISGNLYNELFSKNSKLSTVKTAQLFSKRFPPGLSPYILYLLYSQRYCVHHLVYVSLIFFRFHQCLNNFRSSKNLLANKFFH